MCPPGRGKKGRENKETLLCRVAITRVPSSLLHVSLPFPWQQKAMQMSQLQSPNFLVDRSLSSSARLRLRLLPRTSPNTSAIRGDKGLGRRILRETPCASFATATASLISLLGEMPLRTFVEGGILMSRGKFAALYDLTDVQSWERCRVGLCFTEQSI